MMHCHFLRGLRWASCWDRKWRKMWKVWTRVSPVLTSVSLTRSWSLHTLHKAMRDWCVDDQPDTDVMCFFYHAQPKDSETTRVVPHPTTSWGARSHSESPTYNHHPDSDKPATCLQPVKPRIEIHCIFVPLFSVPDGATLHPAAGPCGRRSQAETLQFPNCGCTDGVV